VELLRGRAQRWHGRHQPRSRPVESDARRGRRAPEHLGELKGVEALPCHQHQHLAIHLAKGSQRLAGGQQLYVELLGAAHDGLAELAADAIDKRRAAAEATRLVRKDPASRRVEPQDARVADRDVIESTPGDGEVSATTSAASSGEADLRRA
jgi:hypothetical protein